MPRASLTTGPCAGRTFEVTYELWERGVMHVIGDPDPAEELGPLRDMSACGGRLPVYTYRRVTIASGPLSSPATVTWQEWHHVPEEPRHARQD